jgi:hypothetical protein
VVDPLKLKDDPNVSTSQSYAAPIPAAAIVPVALTSANVPDGTPELSVSILTVISSDGADV